MPILRSKFRCFTIVQKYKVFCYFDVQKKEKTVKWVKFRMQKLLLAIFSSFYSEKNDLSQSGNEKTRLQELWGKKRKKMKEIHRKDENYSVAVIKNSSENVSNNKRKNEERWNENELVEGWSLSPREEAWVQRLWLL